MGRGGRRGRLRRRRGCRVTKARPVLGEDLRGGTRGKSKDELGNMPADTVVCKGT